MKKKIAGGSLFLFLAALFWSFSGLMIKSVTWDVVPVAIMRGVIGFVVFTVVLRPFPIKLNAVKILTAICYFAQGFLYVLANKFTTAANATMLQYTSPLYIILFTAIATRKFPKRLDVLTCVVLLGGIVLAFAGTIGGGGMLGNVLALISALFYAGVFYFSKLPGANTVESMTIGNIFYVLLLPIVLTNKTVQTSSLIQWGMVLAYGLICYTAAWLCFAKGIKDTPALRANFITMLEPVMAPVWTFLFLQEKITIWSLLGAVVVIGGILVYNTLEQKEKDKQQTA